MSGQLEHSTNIVRVSLPAKVAYDLKSFQKIQSDILGRLGCEACCSGWDTYDVAGNSRLNDKLHVRDIG